ncbi:MAG: VWA domain-containing protein [Planctomycetes bacterium]|nr:VWA domain-containing protein [Planctomycetota bacterium]
MMRFESPWALLSLLSIALYFYLKRRGGGVIVFSSLRSITTSPKTFRQRMLWLLTAFETLALAFLAIALARPQIGTDRVKNISQGVAIAMLVDTSSSMDISMDFSGQRGSRLEIAKEVFQEFVNGDGYELTGRENDLIGMITFARYADTICPLTIDHDAVTYFAAGLEIEDRPNEDGTAIGDAVALAAARLEMVEKAMLDQADDPEHDYEIKSKVIILLTDGENNCGRHMPKEAAAMAKKWGIRIHSIGFGEQSDSRIVQTPDGPQEIGVEAGADTQTLAMLANLTGGIFRMARDADSLRTVYGEIDRMEKTDILLTSHTDYTDAFIPFALTAMAMIFLDALLASTLLRRVP